MAIEFRKITREDSIKFKNWGKHEDIRFLQYNFPYEKDEEYYFWYFSKQKILSKKVYGLFVDEHPMGFITLKNISWFRQSAELGIAIDPNHLGEGYGKIMMMHYLTYIFDHFPIQTMYLKVAEFNIRAQRLYNFCGFEEVTRKKELYEEQSYTSEIMAAYPDLFSVQFGHLYTRFIVMKITKSEFRQKNHEEEIND